MAMALRTLGWGFHTVQGRVIRGANRFRPRIIGLVDIRKAFRSEDGIEYALGARSFTNPSQSAISQREWGFHAVQGGIGPESQRSRPRFFGVVDAWKDF